MWPSRARRRGRSCGRRSSARASPWGRISTSTTSREALRGGLPILFDPQVISDPSGGFAAVWQVRGDDFKFSVRLRFFDSRARPRASEIVAVPSAPKVDYFAADFDDAGHLLLLWRPPLDGILRARLFAAATGAPLGPAFQIGPNPPAICGDAAWTGDSWVITYRTSGDSGQSAIVWRQFR